MVTVTGSKERKEKSLKVDDKEDKLTSKEDRTQQGIEDKAYSKNQDRLTNDIEELKLGKMSSQSKIEYISNKIDKIYWIDDYDHKKYDERDQIRDI